MPQKPKQQPACTVDGAELYAVPGRPGFYVTADGSAVYADQKDNSAPKRCKEYITRNGYRVVRTAPHTTTGVHILVALAFLGPKPSPVHIVARGNGNRQDNRPENLRWSRKAEADRAAFARRNPQPTDRQRMLEARPEAARQKEKSIAAAQTPGGAWGRALQDFQKIHRDAGAKNPLEGPRPDPAEFDDL